MTRRRGDGFQRHAALHGAIHDVLGRASEQGFQGAFRRIAGNARLVKGRLGGFHFRLGAAQVQFADEALFITGRINPERIRTRLDRPLGGRELEIKAPQQEVGVAGLRRDGEPHAALRRFGSEHLIHGGFLGVAELAPEVKFPCRPEARENGDCEPFVILVLSTQVCVPCACPLKSGSSSARATPSCARA